METTKKDLSNITLNGVPLKDYIEEERSNEIQRLHREHLRSASAGVGYISPSKLEKNLSGEKSQRNDDVGRLSEETLVHLNYLHRKGGTEAVNDFLSKPQVQNGSVESALKDAEEKVKFFMIIYLTSSFPLAMLILR